VIGSRICGCARLRELALAKDQPGKKPSGVMDKGLPANLEVGVVVGRLTILSGPSIVFSAGRNRRYWKCRCTCGEEVPVEHYQLLSARTRSCGCFQRELVSAMFTGRGHGESTHAGNTTEYRIWKGIVQRCCNPNDHAFEDYGGRGITICERWRSSYENFLADVGRRPSRDLSIDRIDNNGGYCPGNVHWATMKRQNRNSRQNRLLTFDGITRCIAEWAEITGIASTALYQRIADGWDSEKALTTPVRRFRRRNGV